MQGNVGPSSSRRSPKPFTQSSQTLGTQTARCKHGSRGCGAAECHRRPSPPGCLSDGWPWTIQVSTRNPSNASDGYLWWIGQPGDSAQPTETRISLPTGKPDDRNHRRARPHLRVGEGAAVDDRRSTARQPERSALHCRPADADRSEPGRQLRRDGVARACSVLGPDRRQQRRDGCVVANTVTSTGLRRTRGRSPSAAPRPGRPARSTTRCNGSPITLLTLPSTPAPRLHRRPAARTHRPCPAARRWRRTNRIVASSSATNVTNVVQTSATSRRHRAARRRRCAPGASGPTVGAASTWRRDRRLACRGSTESRSTVVSAAMTSSSGAAARPRPPSRSPAGARRRPAPLRSTGVSSMSGTRTSNRTPICDSSSCRRGDPDARTTLVIRR